MVDTFKASAVSLLQETSFGDNDLNVCSLISLLLRLIVHKCDKTEVNLQDRQVIRASIAFNQPQPK